jgi:predicted HD phosphohydrolase
VDEPEPIDELDHALQAAGLAVAEGADDELVAAALLHDIGRSPALADTTGEHERVAAEWLAPRLGGRVAWLAGAHVAAKVHLVVTDPAYRSQLTPAIVASLAHQDGGDRAAHPWWADALRLRRWDDRAKVPGAPAPSVEDLLPVVARVARA